MPESAPYTHPPLARADSDAGPRTTSKSASNCLIDPFVTCLIQPLFSCLGIQISTSAQSPSDIILFHHILRRYVKHATLIERCFPAERSGETSPNSNELSYLVYYVQSKPAKLAKVGAYLSKRAKRDLQRRRYGDVSINLSIFNALLDSCGRDLNFFAKDILTTLCSSLDSDNTNLVWDVMCTFSLYCKFHTGATLAIDTDLRRMYSHLIEKFVALSQCHTRDPDSTRRSEIGLLAMNAVTGSHATYATDNYYDLPRIVDSVLFRIANSPVGESSISSNDISRIESEIANASKSLEILPNDETLGHWAWFCLKRLVSNSHGQHSRLLVNCVFKNLGNHMQWQPIGLCVRIVTTIIGELQPQDQNMVVVETLAILTDRSSTAPPRSGTDQQSSSSSSSSSHRRRRSCIVQILESLFCGPYILVGISVLEALSVLVTFLLEYVGEDHLLKADVELFSKMRISSLLMQGALNDEKLGESSGDNQHQVIDCYHLLLAIGGLAKHQYYSDQLLDMTNYIISRMSIKSIFESTIDELQNEKQIWLLQALCQIFRTSKKSSVSGVWPTIPFSSFASLFTLLTCQHKILRLQSAECIADILRHNFTTAKSFGPIDMTLFGAACLKIKSYLSNSATRTISDYATVGLALCKLLRVSDMAVVSHIVELIRSPGIEAPTVGYVSLKAMLLKHVSLRLHAHDLGSDIDTIITDASEAEYFDTWIKDVCDDAVHLIPVPENKNTDENICTDPEATEFGKEILRKLDSDSITQTIDAKLGTAIQATNDMSLASNLCDENTNADRILLGSTTKRGVSSHAASCAIEQVNGIRARISVDLKEQDQPFSSVTQQVSLERLRIALHDGISMRSNDYIADLEHNIDLSDQHRVPVHNNLGSSKTSGSPGANKKLLAPNINVNQTTPAMYTELDLVSDSDDSLNSAMLDMHDAHSLPDDVRAILDSIDDNSTAVQ